MAIFAISDLHLSFSVDKPMDVFGEVWLNHAQKLQINWVRKVKNNDVVIIPGDISWAMNFREVLSDLKFINSLPGKKIILKGNHDYWWGTYTKMQDFINKNGLETISFLYNNSYEYDNVCICGTRGWKCPGEKNFDMNDEKMYKRELTRFEMSLQSIKKLDGYSIAALHYPPFNSQKDSCDFMELMKKYNINKCVYGHIHMANDKEIVQGNFEGIEFEFVSSDFLKFDPIKIK